MLADAKPDLVLVHGDTTTTLTGAMAAMLHQIPVGHVEAGLRTYDKSSPFPEELNRTLVADIAQLHFSSDLRPTPTNLRREAVDRRDLHHRQHGHRRHEDDGIVRISSSRTRALNQLDYRQRVIVMTCHRRENYGAPMAAIMQCGAAPSVGAPGGARLSIRCI